jgi:hypothetical protein
MEFVDRVEEAIGERHFPVFRFGDGECVFSVGYRVGRPPPRTPWLKHYPKALLSAYIKHRLHRNFRSGSGGYGYELYSYTEWREARPRFARYIAEIAREGLIGFNFVVQFGVPFCDRYMGPVCDWLERSGVSVDGANFVPCYFVYALLLGPDRRRLLAGRRTLLVTSGEHGKDRLLTAALAREGARSVQFLPISRSKAMFDRVDLEKVQRPIHVALVGAGVGASNLISQLKPLNAVCLDAGYVLDCYADETLKGTRVFTLPDEEMHQHPIRYGSAQPGLGST